MYGPPPFKKREKLSVLFLLFLLFLTTAYSEVEESKILVDVTVPEGYKKVEAGSYFLVPVEILLLTKEQKSVDLLIEYSVNDSNGDNLFKLSETKAARERLTTIREFRIPENSQPGIYVIEVKTSYNHYSHTNTAMFEVVKSTELGSKDIKELQENFTILASSFVLMALFFLISTGYEYRRVKRLGEMHRISAKDLKNEDIWR